MLWRNLSPLSGDAAAVLWKRVEHSAEHCAFVGRESLDPDLEIIGRGRFAGAVEQPSERNLQDFGQFHQLRQFGNMLVALPAGYGLFRDLERFADLLLRQPRTQSLAGSLDTFS